MHAVRRKSDLNLKAFTGKYSVTPPSDAPPGMELPSMTITADQEGPWLDTGMGNGKHRFLPLSSAEFFDRDRTDIRLTFTKDEKGQIIGLTLTGDGPVSLKARKLP
jgi:hypothetical protein